jgi:hypothetical protein
MHFNRGLFQNVNWRGICVKDKFFDIGLFNMLEKDQSMILV